MFSGNRSLSVAGSDHCSEISTTRWHSLAENAGPSPSPVDSFGSYTLQLKRCELLRCRLKPQQNGHTLKLPSVGHFDLDWRMKVVGNGDYEPNMLFPGDLSKIHKLNNIYTVYTSKG